MSKFMVSLVLLPIFSGFLSIELTLMGLPPTGSILTHVGQAVVDYVGLWLPMAVGVTLHSLALLVLPLRLARGAKKAMCYLSSFVVPVIAMLFDSGTRIFLTSYPASTVVATLAYAYASTVGLVKYSRVSCSPESSGVSG